MRNTLLCLLLFACSKKTTLREPASVASPRADETLVATQDERRMLCEAVDEAALEVGADAVADKLHCASDAIFTVTREDSDLRIVQGVLKINHPDHVSNQTCTIAYRAPDATIPSIVKPVECVPTGP